MRVPAMADDAVTRPGPLRPPLRKGDTMIRLPAVPDDTVTPPEAVAR